MLEARAWLVDWWLLNFDNVTQAAYGFSDFNRWLTQHSNLNYLTLKMGQDRRLMTARAARRLRCGFVESRQNTQC